MVGLDLPTDKEQKQELNPSLLVLSQEDLQGLPPELLQEIKSLSRDKMENEIIEIINANSGYITLDQLLARIYKKTGEIYKRTSLTSKLWKMSKSGWVHNLPGRQGVYTTIPQASEQITQIAQIAQIDLSEEEKSIF